MNGRRLPSAKPRLRKRELALAVAGGLLAAGGAAAVIEGMHEDSRPRQEHVAVVSDGNSTDRTYNVGPFAEVVSLGPQDVVITYGEAFSVRAEGTGNALANLEVGTDGDKLTIKPRDENAFSGRGGSSTTIYVTLPKLEGVTLAGSGDMTVDKAEGDSFKAVIAGSGDLTIDGLKVDRAELDVGGVGTLSASGSARTAKVSIGGKGEVDAGDLMSEDADINIAGLGDVGLHVSNRAKISIVGSGDVAIEGTDNCSVSKFGRGDVTCNGQDMSN